MSTEKTSDNTERNEVSSLDDINEAAGTTGVWNYVILFCCSWASFVTPWHTISYQFLGATPPYWCQIDELTKANWTSEQVIALSVPRRIQNSSRIESCSKYELNYTLAAQIGFDDRTARFDELMLNRNESSCTVRHFDSDEPITVVTMFDLVCNRRAIYSTTQSCVIAGKMVGSILIGYLTDSLGRRRVIVWSIPAHLFIGMVTVFSPNVAIYILLKFLISAVAVAFYLSALILALELASTRQRSWIGPLFAIPWALGYMMFPGVAYYIRSFPYLQAAITSVILTLLPLIWILPESPRWLVSQGRFQDAVDVYKMIARKNNRPLPSNDEMVRVMEQIHEQSTSLKSDAKCDAKKFYGLILLPKWRWMIPIIFFGWMSASLVYYGVSLNPPNLSDGKYMFIFLGGLLEIPAYAILWPMSAYLGRKRSMVILYVFCSLAIFAAMAIEIHFHREAISSSATVWLYILSLLGKFSITAAYQLIWYYSVEIFPTNCRSIMVGQSSVAARCGSIFSPYIVDLLGDSVKWAPPAIFASIALISGALLTFLPETKDVELDENPEKRKSKGEENHIVMQNINTNETS